MCGLVSVSGTLLNKAHGASVKSAFVRHDSHMVAHVSFEGPLVWELFSASIGGAIKDLGQ
jgi:hypothetical protein